MPRRAPLPAGELREVVRLQNPPGAADGSGGFAGEWTDVASVRAKVEALDGNEQIEAAVTTGVTRFRVTMREREVRNGQRFLWENWVLDVWSVMPDPVRQATVVLCQGVPA